MKCKDDIPPLDLKKRQICCDLFWELCAGRYGRDEGFEIWSLLSDNASLSAWIKYQLIMILRIAINQKGDGESGRQVGTCN